jgi:gluconolactonase
VVTRAEVEVLAEGVGHPEGPCVLDDGRVVFANTYASEASVWAPGATGATTYAYTGGGPNACVLGSDGCIYVTQSPTVGAWVPDDPRPASIQKVWPDGRAELLCTEVAGIPLTAPNDLCFAPDGRLLFTDSGDWDEARRPHKGWIFALRPDGSGEVVVELEPVYPNGLVCEEDGSVVWVESYTRQVWRQRADGARELLHTLPEGHVPDGFKIAVDGSFWIATFSSGGVDVVARDGGHVDFLETGGVPLNCTFLGESLVICEFGTTDTSGPAPMCGRLIRVEVGTTGAPVHRGAIG